MIPERGIPVISCAQPEAQLAAIGAQWLLPRRRPAPFSGRWVAIWASTGLTRIWALPGDCEGNYEGSWFYGYIGPYQASYCVHTGDEGRRGDTSLAKIDDHDPAPEYDGSMPRSAVVGVAWLQGSAPVGGPNDFSTGLVEGEQPDWGDDPVLVIYDDKQAILDWPHAHNQIVSDQLSYANFDDTRWVWILQHARLLDSPFVLRRPAGNQPWIWEPPADLILPTMVAMS